MARHELTGRSPEGTVSDSQERPVPRPRQVCAAVYRWRLGRALMWRCAQPSPVQEEAEGARPARVASAG